LQLLVGVGGGMSTVGGMVSRILIPTVVAAVPQVENCSGVPPSNRQTCGTIGRNESDCLAGSCCYDSYNNWCFQGCPAGATLKWDRTVGSSVWGACGVASPGGKPAAVLCGTLADGLVSLDPADGTTLWQSPGQGDEVNADVSTSADGQLVYWALGQSLRASWTSNGSTLWTVSATDSMWSPRESPDATMVCAGSLDGVFRCVRRNTGELMWSVQLPNWIRSAPCYAPGVVIFGTRDNHTYCMDAVTGESRWAFKTGGHVPATPWAAGGIVYVASEDAFLYAINITTGELVWKVEVGGSIRSSPVVAEDRVYFGCDDEHVYSVGLQERAVLWSYKVAGGLLAAPLPTPEGGIVIGSGGGTLYHLSRDGKLVQEMQACTSLAAGATRVGNDVVCGDTGGRIYSVTDFM